jgi:peptidoglycan hydrolase CwlO-like protein
MFTQFELELAQRETSIRRYQNRKSRLIRRQKSLQKLRNQLKQEQRSFVLSEKELERKWNVLQRQMWSTDAEIKQLKLRRRRHHRRVVDLTRRLRGRLDPIIGLPPDEADE